MGRASGCGGLAAQAAAATGVTAATSSQASAKGEVYEVHDTPTRLFLWGLCSVFETSQKKKHLNEWKPDRFD